MKLRIFTAGRRTRAFTLTELMISMSVLMIVMAGVITSHVMGLKLYGMTKAKLGANEYAREAVNGLMEDLRSSGNGTVLIGSGSASSFTSVGSTNLQVGNAIQLTFTNNNNYYIRYFLDSSTGKLMRNTYTNGTQTSTDVVAEYLTNTTTAPTVFQLQSPQGSNLTASVANPVISVTLSFYQVRYPIVAIGTPGAYFDRYELRTKITPR